MPIDFYETETVLRDLKQHNLFNAYERWKERLRGFGRIDGQRDFNLTRGGNRLHEFGNETSIAIRLHTIEVDRTTWDILETLKVFTRDFPGEALEIQLGKLHSNVSDDTLGAWEKDKLMQKPIQQETTSPMEPLPSELREWFNVGEWKTAGDRDPMTLTVYETKLWREDVKNVLANNRLAQIHTALSVFYLDGQDEIKTIRKDDFFYEIDIPGEWMILCNYRKETGDRRNLVLLGIYDPNSGENKADWIQGIKQKYAEQAPKLFPLPKSYPGLLLYEETHRKENGMSKPINFYKLWLETENEEAKANLAMSGEEMGILHDLTAGGAMPTFINGPAGSGKSTILHYLFVHFWNHKKLKKLPQDLLFITLSKTLLGKAQEVVQEIQRLEFLSDNPKNQNEDQSLLPSFRAFRDILAKIIGPDITNYPPEREIDFEAFKELFNPVQNNPASRFPARLFYRGQSHKGISAELCWHIIRSYIKGYSVDGQMTPEQFQQLRQQGVFVSQEAYRIVYEEVWPWYTRLTSPCKAGDASDRYWDQQDLARAVLIKLSSPVKFWPEEFRNIAVIFCDEAQDFTGVELKIVQRLSMLTRYDLSYQTMLPFAFAGDPMQSLNPSGFRWEDLRASMYQNLVKENKCNCAVEIKSLSLNYRSPKEITYLANLIQLVRGNIFNEPMQAQEPLSTDEGVPPMLYLFEEGKLLSSDELSHLAGSIILLPCSAGREDSFIDHCPILKQIRENDANQVFMSVMTAKGLDIQKVIVFAFGEELFPDQLKLYPSEDIALAYAFNQVYVAITRATHQLLIMETQKGYENLWKVLAAKETKDYCLTHIRDSEKRKRWESNLSQLALRSTGMADFRKMSDGEIGRQAEDLEKDAKETQSPELMRRAANFFSRAMRKDDEERCLAFVEMYEKHFLEAAKLFRRCRDFKPAELVDCLWQGEDWKGLCDPGLDVPPEKRAIAQFMSDSVTMKTLDSFIRATFNYQFPPDGPWRKALERLCDFALRKQTLLPNEKPIIDSLANYLIQQNHYAVIGVQKAVGHLWTLLNEWEKLQTLPRENLSDNDRLQFYAHSAPWPEFILACRDLNRISQDGKKCFAERWRSCQPSSHTSLDEEQKDAVIQLLLDNKMNQDALHFAERYDYVPAWEFFPSHDDFSTEMAFLRMVLKNRSSRWATCNKILRCVSLLLRQPDEMRQLLDLIAGASSILVQDLSRESKGVFENTLLDICKKHLPWFENETDLIRVAAAFEKIGLGRILSQLGETFMEHYDHAPLLKEVAIRIYVRGRRIYTDYEGKKDQNLWVRYREDSRKKVTAWGYSSEQFDRFWKNADTEFLRPQYFPAAEDALLNLQAGSDGVLKWECSPLKGEVCENELIVHHESNRRKCLFYFNKNKQTVFLGDDSPLSLEIGKTQSIPFGDNQSEVELVLRDSGELEIKHCSWPVSRVFFWPQ